MTNQLADRAPAVSYFQPEVRVTVPLSEEILGDLAGRAFLSHRATLAAELRREALPSRDIDSRLMPFLRARGEPEAQRRLADLMQEVEPVIRGVLRRRGIGRGCSLDGLDANEQTAEDLHGEARLRVLIRLRELRDSASVPAIRSFRSFVATTTCRVFADYMREKYPQRSSLKQKLLDLVTEPTRPCGLAAWSTPSGQRACGPAEWHGQEVRRTAAYVRLVVSPHAFARLLQQQQQQPIELNLADLLAVLFEGVGGPVELDDLVQVVAALWEISDRPPQPLQSPGAEEEGPGAGEQAAPHRHWENVVATEVEQREYVRRMWSEICQLPLPQRVALLLNPKDGGGAIELLELRGFASFREIAAALAISPQQFAALSGSLPMDDNQIAERLGCTRQQVINLRKAARDRLERRINGAEREPCRKTRPPAISSAGNIAPGSASSTRVRG